MKILVGHATHPIAGALGLTLCLAAAAQAPGVRMPPPPVVQPAPAPGAALRPPPAVNCGTFWTGWFKPIDPKTNPCPAGCEPAEKVQEKRHQQGAETWIDAQYRCTRVAGPRAAGLEGKPVRDARPPSQVVGTLTPGAGPWHSRVIVKGPGFGKAEQTRVIWYPNDDDAQPPAGSTNATLRQRLGDDQIEIEMPNGAGGTMGAVVRVLVFMPGQLQPLLAGRFTVATKAAAVAESQVADAKPRPWSVTTPPIQMTGTFVEQRGSHTRLHVGPDAFAVTTPAIQMTGTWLASRNGGAQGDGTPAPFALTTPAIQMTGTWQASRDTRAAGDAAPVPFAVTTPTIQMTGVLELNPGAKTRLRELAPAPAVRPPR